MAVMTERVALKLRRAVRDDALATMGVADAMRKHGLRHGLAAKAIRAVRERLGTEKVERAERRKRVERKYATLRGANGRYPGILARIHSEGNNFAIARDFGISREWVRVLRGLMSETVKGTGRAASALLDELAA